MFSRTGPFASSSRRSPLVSDPRFAPPTGSSGSLSAGSGQDGAERVDAACARAIAFEVYDVPRIGRMLKLARWSEAGAEAAGKVVRLPGRFARATEHFTTQRPKDGGAP